MTAPQAWYQDPWDPTQFRWWDGTQWTAHTHAAETNEVVVKTETTVVATPQNVWASASSPSPSRAAKAPNLSDVIAGMHLEPFRELEEQLEAVGETFHVKGIKRVFADAHRRITVGGATIESVTCALLPEPWNPHDSCAVAVMVGRHHVGYLSAEDAREYSEPLCRMAANGTVVTGNARIWALDDAGVVRARVTVLIPAADTL